MNSACANVPEKTWIVDKIRIENMLHRYQHLHVLKSDSSYLQNLFCYMTQCGGNAYDLGCYFAKWCIQSRTITKKKKPSVLAPCLRAQPQSYVGKSKQSAWRRKTCFSPQEVTVNGKSRPNHYTGWSPSELTSCVIKKNWWKLVLFPSTMCLPPMRISASLK